MQPRVMVNQSMQSDLVVSKSTIRVLTSLQMGISFLSGIALNDTNEFYFKKGRFEDGLVVLLTHSLGPKIGWLFDFLYVVSVGEISFQEFPPYMIN